MDRRGAVPGRGRAAVGPGRWAGLGRAGSGAEDGGNGQQGHSQQKDGGGEADDDSHVILLAKVEGMGSPKKTPVSGHGLPGRHPISKTSFPTIPIRPTRPVARQRPVRRAGPAGVWRPTCGAAMSRPRITIISRVPEARKGPTPRGPVGMPGDAPGGHRFPPAVMRPWPAAARGREGRAGFRPDRRRGVSARGAGRAGVPARTASGTGSRDPRCGRAWEARRRTRTRRTWT